MPYSYQKTSRVLYIAKCNEYHCTLLAFELFGALHSHDVNDLPCWDLSPVSRGLELEPNPISDQNTLNNKKLELCEDVPRRKFYFHQSNPDKHYFRRKRGIIDYLRVLLLRLVNFATK